jgi:hypothetical protein
MAKKIKKKDLEENEEEEAEKESERVTSKDAGKGLIILGCVLILIAVFMPFVLGTSDQKMWSLGSEILIFWVMGAVAIVIGIILLNFERLSRKL